MAKILGSGEVSIPVYILVILFGTGSWVAVNGLWVEVPLLVQDLPESWNLPSFLVIIIQIANIGPLVYSLARKCCKNYVSERLCIYVLVLIGAISCILLSFMWKHTMTIAGSLHSIALFILAFCLATVDCTSSVVFLPFMSRLKPQYLTAFFIGEGLSGLLPSLVALIQGASGSESCVNQTITNSTTGKNQTILVPVVTPPLFSVDVFFVFLFAMMIVCGLSFAALNYLPVCKKEHVTRGSETSSGSGSGSGSSTSSQDIADSRIIYKPVMRDDGHLSGSVDMEECDSTQPLQIHQEPQITKRTFIYLLVLMAWVNAMSNGILPSIQSYSALPYGYTPYHLAVTLSSLANPLTCFLLFAVPCSSKKLVAFLTMVGTAFLGYLSFLAASSPSPPLAGQTLGAVVMVTVWILNTAVLSCVKVVVATVMRQAGGKNALFWYGATEQIGSALGAMFSFTLTDDSTLAWTQTPRPTEDEDVQ